MSLTGDAATDALVPIAQRMVGAVRDGDSHAIDQALADTIDATGGRCQPERALLVVVAGMVPDDVEPSRLLAWIGGRSEFDRLVARGVPADVAREVTSMREAA